MSLYYVQTYPTERDALDHNRLTSYDEQVMLNKPFMVVRTNVTNTENLKGLWNTNLVLEVLYGNKLVWLNFPLELYSVELANP